jgi:hypothetical protein
MGWWLATIEAARSSWAEPHVLEGTLGLGAAFLDAGVLSSLACDSVGGRPGHARSQMYRSRNSRIARIADCQIAAASPTSDSR